MFQRLTICLFAGCVSSTFDTSFADKPGILPWQVHFQISGKPETSCGGALLNFSLVVTAAHCVHGLDPSILSIRAGGLDSFVQVRKARRILIHPRWNKTSIHEGPSLPLANNNIALVHLVKPLFERKDIQPIQLVGGNDTLGKESCVSWGLQQDSEKRLPFNFQKIHLQLVQQELCEFLYEGSDVLLDNTMRCAGNPEAIVFMGSGLPLACKNQENTTVLAGIATYSNARFARCGPTIFTKVEEFKDFIDGKLNASPAAPISVLLIILLQIPHLCSND